MGWVTTNPEPNFLVIFSPKPGGMASNQSATSSRGGATSGAFGPSRLMEIPKGRSGIRQGKFGFM